jgi:hypothetical protein
MLVIVYDFDFPIVGVAPCLLQLVGLLVTPESPRWLVSSFV